MAYFSDLPIDNNATIDVYALLRTQFLSAIKAKREIENRLKGMTDPGEIRFYIKRVKYTPKGASKPRVYEYNCHYIRTEEKVLDKKNREKTRHSTRFLKNDKYEVQIGIVSVKVAKEDLQKDNNPKINNKKSLSSNNNTVVSIKKNVSSKLDLRGLRYEEAEDVIDKFIDDAIYANLKSVTIIHGFGTGTIRKLVHQKLDRNKFVEEYHYGGQGEGGQGATIVNFK